LQAAIAIAQAQKARSFELRAALSLAKLYRAANRDADAYAVLAGGRGLPADPTIPRTRRGANPSRGSKPLDRIGVDQIRLRLASSPSTRRRNHRRRCHCGNSITGFTAAPTCVSGGVVEAGKIVTRDEPVERYPAPHEKIDEDEVSGRLWPRITFRTMMASQAAHFRATRTRTGGLSRASR